MRDRSSVVFAAAAGITAVHVADDATLAREPGTSVADHLPSAGLTVLALAAVALVFPRLRDGARAAAALLAGALAATYGGLTLAEGFADGLHRSAATGLPALAAGLVLLGLGAITLWRSRRRDEPRASRYGRRALLGVASLLVLLAVVLPVLLAVGFTHKPRTSVDAADLGLAHEDVAVRTSDGLTLRGWYVPSRNGAAVLAFPGRHGPLPHARLLASHGYGVLLLDMRGNGESDGDSNPLGWGSGRDVRAAIDYLAARPDVDDGRIGGLGLSVGGELLLEAAASDDRLRAVVSEGAGYRTLSENLDTPGATRWVMLPQTVTLLGALRLYGHESPPTPLTELVPRIAPRRTLLIEAGHGQGGEELNGLYRRLAGPSSTHWLIPEAGHTGGLDARPAEYERRVVGFFDRTLAGGDGA
jgi:hypothetical protein